MGTVYKARAKFQNKQPKYKVFYENGRTFTDTSGTLDSVPKQGVVAIKVESGDTFKVEKGCDNYCYTPQGWIGVSQAGLTTYLMSPGYKLVLFGAVISADKEQEILTVLDNDTYLK